MVRCASSSDDMVFKNRSGRLMEKPSQYEIDTCIEVLEYGIADLNQNEPHAINTINTLEQALSELPRCEEEFGEVN